MKRDVDLIRKLLTHIEEHDRVPDEIDDCDVPVIDYHTRLLAEAGFIRMATRRKLSRAPENHGMITEDILPTAGERTSLTWQGHEFLDSARNSGVWHKAKAIVADGGGSVSMSIFSEILKKVTKEFIGLP